MEKELNIAAILNEKPTETKLWSTMLGDCIYCYNNTYPEEIIIAFTDKNGEEKEWTFSYSGRTISAPDTADVCLFPSKQMRDWHKFAWKKGDVLVSNDGGTEVIFDKWYDDTYTNFYSKHYLNSEDENNIKYFEGFVCTTDRYFLESKDAAQTYINTLEERLGGKLNLETLEIEQPKREFKDGDIVHIPAGYVTEEAIFIAKVEAKGVLHSYVYMSKDSMIPLAKSLFRVFGCLDSLRLATENEKQQLFSALAKEGKRWNAENKQIEDLPKKCEFKTMDWCLMKYKGHYSNRSWELCQYAYTEHRVSICYKRDFYHAVGGEIYAECIPYNDQTKHLLGTTDDWKGGEE